MGSVGCDKHGGSNFRRNPNEVDIVVHPVQNPYYEDGEGEVIGSEEMLEGLQIRCIILTEYP